MTRRACYLAMVGAYWTASTMAAKPEYTLVTNLAGWFLFIISIHQTKGTK